MSQKKDFSKFHWINQPEQFTLEDSCIKFTTEPRTDNWQRTYYGFRHDNAHAFVLPVKDNEFSFLVKTEFEPKKLFDQCGVVLYQDSDNWFKGSVEFDNACYSRLGSVVTNLGFSDWSSTDIDSKTKIMYYRLSRRDQDFMVENSFDGVDFKQMRIFHIHKAIKYANIGIYACSPLESSVKATFSEFSLGECVWENYVIPDLEK